MATLVAGGTVLTPDGALHDHDVVLDGGRIAEIRPAQRQRPADDRVVDAAGGWVVPGFVDVHVHGGGGHDVMDATPEALEGLSRHLAAHGVTSFVPTTTSASGEATTAALDAVADAMAGLPGARALGAHLEGPYLDPDHCGAHDAAALRLPDPDEYEDWLTVGVVRLLTLAPELAGADELVAAARPRNVVVAAGHCGATEAQMRAAVDAGVRHATHAFNAMPPLHHRDPGAVGVALTDDRVRAELIADGVHLHPTVMRLVARAKGATGTVAVSDGMRAAGMPDGAYELGGQQVTVRQGLCHTTDGRLAGSTVTLDRAVANLVELAGVPLADAVAMASTTPATVVGHDREVGALAIGYRADVAVLDADLTVTATIVDGAIVHLLADEQ